MSPYRVEFQPSARKELLKLDKPVRRRILRAVAGLGDEPRPSGAVALKNRPDQLRIRVGNYRVVYTVRDAQLLVLVLAVGHRGEVYRDLG